MAVLTLDVYDIYIPPIRDTTHVATEVTWAIFRAMIMLVYNTIYRSVMVASLLPYGNQVFSGPGAEGR